LGSDDPFLAGNAAVHPALNDAGIRHRFIVAEGRHDWVFWRQALPEAARHVGAVMRRQYGEQAERPRRDAGRKQGQAPEGA